jgi:hypothetical protein
MVGFVFCLLFGEKYMGADYRPLKAPVTRHFRLLFALPPASRP